MLRAFHREAASRTFESAWLPEVERRAVARGRMMPQARRREAGFYGFEKLFTRRMPRLSATVATMPLPAIEPSVLYSRHDPFAPGCRRFPASDFECVRCVRAGGGRSHADVGGARRAGDAFARPRLEER